MSPDEPPSLRTRLDLRRGILLMCAAVVTFTISSTMVKGLGPGYPVSQIVFFRCVLAFVPIFFVVHRAGGWHVLRTKRPGAHLFRVAVGGVALFIGFYALTLMPLADYFAFTYAAPLFATLLSIPILGERVGIRRWSAVAVGFAGVLVMLQPGFKSFAYAEMVAIGAAFTYALAIIAVRNLARTEHSASTVFYFTFAGMLLSAAILPFEWRTPTLRELGLLLGIGLMSGIGQLLVTDAYRLAPTSVVAPFDYTSMLWALVLGYALFGDFPEPIVLAGAAVVIASGVYIIYRETVRGVTRPPIAPTPLK
ncbi:MAG: DMT family transporter [Candidatus Odyssella sp.]|nr:DMT family transporter [Candidatus Odyssella sp.]